ncbi:MAG: DUF2116 family Zn-ribbon domain-containing protein [Ruminococcus sp.]|nr:DUF2116 family Zn-ribbon domain-containing protein [Oscillospiraceae bacterium]MBR2724050.1 DUF2116 family Zn-ribbon domain-containing protein [Ruminococcus sp.]
MKTCEYCAKEISYHEMYCSDACEQKHNTYFRKRTKFQKVISIINILGTFSIAIGIFLYALQNLVGSMMIACGALAIGVLTSLLPAPTDNMIKKHKLQKAVKLTRYFGFVLLAIGIGALIFALTKI